jgi:hypothetical protein
MAGAWRHVVVKFVLVEGKLETAEDVDRFLAPSGPAALKSPESR